MIQDYCKDCRFADFDVFGVEDGAGYCRLNPPVFVDGWDYAQWPTISEKDWCGKFEATA